ncbi:MAG TPA: MerR family transcriptional regulator [Chloroflexia bacterium]|nr:MerR family transcriptional regulator [Chloroflexia bacterium]
MFKIGDFSKLSLVSVRMLRYYDEMGLLKPVKVDNFTGYRFYSAQQLAQLNRILALKDLGLSLEQIAKVLNEGLTSEQIRGMLRLKQLELSKLIHDEQARLERIEAWLEREELVMSDYTVVIKKVEPLLVVEAKGVAPDLELIGPTLDRLFDEAGEYAKQQGYKACTAGSGETFGPGTTVYYDMEYCEKNIQVGACLPISRVLPSSERIEVKTLPGYDTIASVIHNGSFSGLAGAYKAVMDWIEANNYHICGPNRELNLEYERGGDQSKYVTEIQVPVSR